MRTRKDVRRDEWDARLPPPKPRRSRGNRSLGLTLMLLGIGLPLVLFFIQDDGALRFSARDQVYERTLTTAEQQEIHQAIVKQQAKLDEMARIVEKIKQKYRGETGASYDRDVWVVHVRDGLAIPYKYVLAFGGLLFLVGLGRFFV